MLLFLGAVLRESERRAEEEAEVGAEEANLLRRRRAFAW